MIYNFQDEWKWSVFFYSLWNGMFSILFVSRLMGYHSIGQKMANHYSQIKTNLQNALLFELSSKTHLEVAIERFSRAAPIRPMDVFDLNLASGASILGLLVTYLIVLFQFKIGDNFAPTEGGIERQNSTCNTYK